MAQKIFTNWDLKRNQLVNARLQNSATHPTNPAEGFIYYNTTDKCFYIYQDGQWVNHTLLTSSRITDFATAVKAFKLNEMTTPDADVSMGGNALTNVKAGVNATDAVNKGQLDALVARMGSPLRFISGFDASVGTFDAMADAKQGDFYKVTVSGTIGTIDFVVGDAIIIDKDVVGVPTEADIVKIDNTEAPDIVRVDAVQTLTNKTIDADLNVITNLEVDNFKAGVIVTNLTDVSDSKIATAKAVKDAMDAEKASKDQALADVNARVDTEITNRANSDATLQTNIDQVATDLATETSNRVNSDNAIQAELDATQVGAGLGIDGTYTPKAEANYIAEATSLKDADEKLDSALKAGLDQLASQLSSAVTDLSADIADVATELDATQLGAGLGTDGVYTPYGSSNYIAGAISLKNADFLLDTAIKALADDTTAKLTVIKTGAGLETDGTYVRNNMANYIDQATSLKDADNKLDTALAGVDGRLGQEIADRQLAVQTLGETLTTAITAEQTARENADTAIRTDLASTATGKGASLVGIEDPADVFVANTVEGALLELKANIASMDSNGSEALNNEIDARIAGDQANATAIANEATARENADTALSNRVTAIENMISTDGTLASNSDSKLPTEQAVKTYVDNSITNTRYASNIGDGAVSTFVLTHNLGSTDVIVQVKEVATGDVVITDINITSNNTVTIGFGDYVPAVNEFRVVVQK